MITATDNLVKMTNKSSHGNWVLEKEPVTDFIAVTYKKG